MKQAVTFHKVTACTYFLAPPRGLEPPTHGLGNRRSIR